MLLERSLLMLGGVFIFALAHFLGNGFGIAAVVLIAAANEFAEWWEDGTPDWRNAAAVLAGGGLGWSCTL